MGTSRGTTAVDTARHDAGPSESEIRAQVARILESPAFRGSHRSQEFLQFITDRTLSGHQAELKERNIAVDVFGRLPEVNLTEDTIVRVSAREVRRRLDQYYASDAGVEDPVRISLPPGSYVPEFRYAETNPLSRNGASPGGVVASQAAARGGLSHIRKQWRLILLLLPLMAAVVIAFRGRLAPHPSQAAFERFWSPLLGANQEVLIGVPHPIVYHPSVRATRENSKRLLPQALPFQRPLVLRPEELTGADFVPVMDQYVAFGDLLAVSSIQSLLAVRGNQARIRLASKIDLADLKDMPSVLVGAYTNRWTLELGQNLRFRFAYTSDGRACILDSTTPEKRWALHSLTSDGTSDQDYLLISRLVHSSTGQPAVLLAGLKQFGTGAGGQLLASPVQLSDVLKSLPGSAWASSNLQIILQMRVIDKTPSPPSVVAWHIW